MTRRYVVSGTDTGIGKTIFSAALTASLNAYYWKPVQSGLDQETDSETIARLGSVSPQRIVREAYRLMTPASPHYSARLDGIEIDPDVLTPPYTPGPLVIEGAGGLLVPLNERFVFADIFARWKLPVILCARTTLGTINHTLLSVEALGSRNIPICGIAFIGDENHETQRIIARKSGSRILGRLPHLPNLTPEVLFRAFRDNFDPASF